MTTYRAESDDLTAVADAIRTKAGTTDKLSWPTGYVSAVQGIKGIKLNKTMELKEKGGSD